MAVSGYLHRGTWFTDALATAKLGLFIGAGRFFIEYFIGKFPSLATVAGVHLVYLAFKYSSIRLYGSLGDLADRRFPKEKTNFLVRAVVHGTVLSIHTMPLYTLAVLLNGLELGQAVPGLLWYAGSNMLTGFLMRWLVLRERVRRFNRKSKTP